MKKITLIFIIIFLNNQVLADDKMKLGLKVYNEKELKKFKSKNFFNKNNK